MDPLSELLTLLRPHHVVSAGIRTGGDWAIGFRGHARQIKCYVVLAGTCQLVVEGVDEITRLEAGDCFVIPNGRTFRMASDLSLSPVSASTILGDAHPGKIAQHGDGCDVTFIGSRFQVTGGHADLALGLLPPVLHLRSQADRDAQHWAVQRMMTELHDDRPGGDVIAQDLAHMMLVHALRGPLAEGMAGGTGWIFALADRQLGMVIRAIHAEPARNWTIHELGALVGMSRSVLALRFRKTVGEAPIRYLALWRMMLACDRLEQARDPIATVADDLGYASESAFSTAFKRIVGCAPRQYVARHRRQTAT